MSDFQTRDFQIDQFFEKFRETVMAPKGVMPVEVRGFMVKNVTADKVKTDVKTDQSLVRTSETPTGSLASVSYKTTASKGKITQTIF